MWSAAPGDDWPAMLAEAVGGDDAVRARARSSACPTTATSTGLDAALTDRLGEGHHVC